MHALADGGPDTLENLITLCSLCHAGWHRCEGWITFDLFMSQTFKGIDRRRQRQLEGIEKAKAKGIYRGRKPSIDRDKIVMMIGQGKGATEIAKELGIGRASIYRIVNNDGRLGSAAETIDSVAKQMKVRE